MAYPALKIPSIPRDTIRREVYFLNLYRVFEAVIYIALAFSPFAVNWVSLAHPSLAHGVALAYLAVSSALLLGTDYVCRRLHVAISGALITDVIATTGMLAAFGAQSSGIAMMLMVNIGAAALLLPLRYAAAFAALAALSVLGQTLLAQLLDGVPRGMVEPALFGVAYFAVAASCYYLGRQMRETEALAAQRGVDLLNLEQINDLIIRRMRTGMLLVDGSDRIVRINESAWQLLGSPPPQQRELKQVAPELMRRLQRWRKTGKTDQTAVALADGVAEVIPRFTRLTPSDHANSLIFLDDTSLLSQRAEALTLSSLGQLSASIAHEIRNPLAAIRYSAQLLEESTQLTDADKRLVEIINNHCMRANHVVEHILQLSRRERSRPENIDLNAWVQAFVDEYQQTQSLGQDRLYAQTQAFPIEATIDPQHLQQVVWNLVQNALRYGRQPNQPAQVWVVARLNEQGAPILEVIDRGPGVPPALAGKIFEPFFTTYEYGSGLGLYLAKQMCESNQATLEYLSTEEAECVFRITLAQVTPLLGLKVQAS